MSDPESVVTYQVPLPGMTWIQEERSGMQLVIQTDGGELAYKRTKVTRKRVEVLGATSRIVVRARLTYLEHVDVETQNLAARQRPSPLEGKRYVIDATGGVVTVTGDGGAPLSVEEEAAVRTDEKRFGGAETLGMMVARLQYRVGEPVSVPAQVAAQAFGGDLAVTAMKLTYLGTAGADVAFALELGLFGGRGSTSTELKAAGSLRVDRATAQPLELRVLGPVRTTGAMASEGIGELVAVRVPVMP